MADSPSRTRQWPYVVGACLLMAIAGWVLVRPGSFSSLERQFVGTWHSPPRRGKWIFRDDRTFEMERPTSKRNDYGTWTCTEKGLVLLFDARSPASLVSAELGERNRQELPFRLEGPGKFVIQNPITGSDIATMERIDIPKPPSE